MPDKKKKKAEKKPKKAKKGASTPKKKRPTTPHSDAKSVASAVTSLPSPGGDSSGAGAGAGAGSADSGGAGGYRAGQDASMRTSIDFDAGQLFERYDMNKNGYLDKREFQQMCKERGLLVPPAGAGGTPAGAPADPSPRTSFDAGRLFQRYDAAGRGRLGRAEVNQFLRDYSAGVAGGTGGYAPAMPPPVLSYPSMYGGGDVRVAGGGRPWDARAGRGGAPQDSSFDAGRLFERFDHNKNGAIDRAEFERMVTQLNKQGFKAADPGRGAATRSGHPSSGPAPAWSAPVGGIGMYGGHLSIQDAYRARLSDLTALTAHLMVKRETMMRQLSAVQLHREHIRAAKRAIERETVADTEGILRRLRSAESFKLSLLQHDIDELRNDIGAIDNFHAQFSAYQPRVTPGSMYTDVASNTAMEFLSRYPELCGEADRLATKPVKTTVDVAADDFERETAKRLQSLQKVQALDSLLAERDQMIMELRRQTAASQIEIDEVAHSTSDELAKLWQFTNTVVERLESFRMQCRHCDARLLDTTVNTECDVATAAAAAAGEGKRGTPAGRHHWVKIAASASSGPTAGRLAAGAWSRGPSDAPATRAGAGVGAGAGGGEPSGALEA